MHFLLFLQKQQRRSEKFFEKNLACVSGFEDGGKGPKECRKLLKAGEIKDIGSPLDPPEGNAALLIP